jgi:hypothetical protein
MRLSRDVIGVFNLAKRTARIVTHYFETQYRWEKLRRIN